MFQKFLRENDIEFFTVKSGLKASAVERFNHTTVQFFQDRLILNGVNLRLKLNRAKNSFCVVSPTPGAAFKVVITEAILYVRKVKVASSVTLGHVAALKEMTAKYPMQRVLSIPGGFSSFTPDNLFLGHIPKRLVLVLVDTELLTVHMPPICITLSTTA